MQVNLSSYTKPIIQQRRFKILLLGLISISLLLGIIIVPVENSSLSAKINNSFDGIWWSVITVTGVGYGDMVPVTPLGKIIGMTLAAIGVLSFGLIISMFSNALNETKDRYFRTKTTEQLNHLQEQLNRLEKNESYLIKQKITSPPLVN